MVGLNSASFAQPIPNRPSEDGSPFPPPISYPIRGLSGSAEGGPGGRCTRPSLAPSHLTSTTHRGIDPIPDPPLWSKTRGKEHRKPETATTVICSVFPQGASNFNAVFLHNRQGTTNERFGEISEEACPTARRSAADTFTTPRRKTAWKKCSTPRGGTQSG